MTTVHELGGQEAFFGLDSTSRLYINHTLISPQCLSFNRHLDTQYIAFTIGGRQNAMFFLDSSKTLQQLLLPENRYFLVNWVVD